MSPTTELALLEERDGWCVEVAWWWGDACVGITHAETRRVNSRATLEPPTLVGGASDRRGASHAVIVPGARTHTWELCFTREAVGEVRRGDDAISFLEAIDRGIAHSLGEGFAIGLEADTRCRVAVGDLHAVVSVVRRARRSSRKPRADRAGWFSLLGATSFAAAVLATAFVAVDRDGLLSDPDRDGSLDNVLHALNLSSDFPAREVPIEDRRARHDSSRLGRAHDSSPGAMGSPRESVRDRHYALRHLDDAPRLPHTSPRDSIAARGIFAAIGSPARADAHDAPNSPFGGLDASGDDTLSHQGLMTAETAGNAFGYDGLGRSGIGFGGGGTGEGSIGTSPLGWMGAGRGACGCGEGMNPFGRIGVAGMSGRARVAPSASPPARATSGPHVCGHEPGEQRSCGEPSIQGGLPPEEIRRVVRRNLGQVAHCHEEGLRSDPDLHGRVSVRFVIGSDGGVLASAVVDNVSVPNVGRCIADAVRRWQFPEPPGGAIVTVNYPFRLEQPE